VRRRSALMTRVGSRWFAALRTPSIHESTGLSNYCGSGMGYQQHVQERVSLVHRYYDPTTEQFLSVDPLVDQTDAPYAYTAGDPVNTSDPSGEFGISIPLIGCIGNCGSPKPKPFTCLPSGYYLSAATGAISCASGPIVGGSLRAGSTAAQARAEAEASGYPIPDDYIAEPAGNGQGWVFRVPGTTGNANVIRVGEANSKNPTGYVRYFNAARQPLNAEGKPGPDEETHLPLRGDENEGDGFDPFDPFVISTSQGCEGGVPT